MAVATVMVCAHVCACVHAGLRMHVHMFMRAHVYACVLRPISSSPGPAHCRQAVPELDEGGRVPGDNAKNRTPSHQEG